MFMPGFKIVMYTEKQFSQLIAQLIKLFPF